MRKLIFMSCLLAVCFIVKAQTAAETAKWIEAKFNTNVFTSSTECEYCYDAAESIKAMNAKLTDQYLVLFFTTESRDGRLGKRFSQFTIRINLQKLDTSYENLHSNYWFLRTTSNNISKTQIRTWSNNENVEKVPEQFECCLRVSLNENAEPDIRERLIKAIKHYVSVMTIVSEKKELF